MNFKSNTGEHNYTINQVRSSWDSTALLDNYVSGKADGKYTPVTERGLTIYTYGDNAAWVKWRHTLHHRGRRTTQQLANPQNSDKLTIICYNIRSD